MTVVKNINDCCTIINNLKSANVCQRCMLRFLGERSYINYSTREEVLKRLNQLSGNCEATACCVEKVDDFSITEELITSDEEIVPSAKRHHPTPCTACLGILQDSCDAMVFKIESAVKESGYQFSDFVLHLSLPVVTDLRQRLLFFHLVDNCGTIYGTTVAEDLPSVKEVWKWIVGSQLGKSMNADFSPNSNFQISVFITYPETVEECKKLEEHCPDAFPNRRKKKVKPEDIYTRTAVLKAVNCLSSELQKLYSLPPLPPNKNCIYGDIICTHSPLYIGGRYNKYSRQLSQTPWIVDGERRMETSVKELITDVMQKWIHADKMVFSASGREDVDVKMLGDGRPFVLEILNPKCTRWTVEDMKKIEREINSSTEAIAVRDLQIVSKKDTQHLKEGEEEKRKSYSALCYVKRDLCQEDVAKLSAIKDLKLKQKTPIRVLHRRPLAVRERIIHQLKADIVDCHQLQLYLETQAGTYVKEFVHGDFGRTMPSLGMLLKTEADILELDVKSIHLDWPPRLLI